MIKRIAIFSGVGYGGAHNLIINIAKRLINKNCNVIALFVLPQHEKKNQLLMQTIKSIGKDNIRIFWFKEKSVLGLVGFYITLLRLIRVHKEVASFIKREHFNLLIATHCRYTQSPFLLPLLRSFPIIFLFCEPKREFYEQTSFKHRSLIQRLTRFFLLPLKFIDRHNLRQLKKNNRSLILSISNFSLGKLKSIYGLSGKVLYPGVDILKFHPVKKTFSLKNPRFLSVGAFNFHKGFDFLLEALSFLPPNFRKLTLIGNGGHDLDKILALSKRFNVNLTIKNFISEKKLIENYRRADLFLYAPREEPFGMALFEAMSCGTPVIATNAGGYPEILKKRKGGVFLSKLDPFYFANRITKFMSNKKQYYEYRKSVRKIAEGLKWDSVIDKLYKFVEETAR